MLAVMVLAGCASAPRVDYFTLAAEPSGRAGSDVNLVVERFKTTEALSRSQILIHSAPTRIEYYATDQWAGGLGELVQQKLALEFGPAVAGRRTLQVSGTVLACEQVDVAGGAEARVKLHVMIRDPESKRYEDPLLEKTYTADRPASPSTADGVVLSLSRCVEQIAAEIAADAAAL
jgi:uncharacterized lipoprotein YmbA